MNRVIHFALQQRLLVVLFTLLIIGLGVWFLQQLPIDAFPDISPVMVPVFAEAHGMAPEEVERFITYPIEAAMNGLPGVRQITSTSAFGMAVVYVYFEDDVDIYFARQIVAERLARAAEELPQSDEPPILGPISTGLGQIFIYYLTLEEGAPTDGLPPDIYLRTVNDWIVTFQLSTVRGVTDILSIGGNVLQYQIQVDPYELIKYGLTIDDVMEAVETNNRNVGGQFIVRGSEEYLVRGLGLIGSLEDIRTIKLKTVKGTPLYVRDIGNVEVGPAIRRGVVTRNGEEEVVSGIVLMLYGENTSSVIKRLYEKIESVQKTLPDGVRLIPYYEQAELVQRATGTVTSALLLGGLLVIAVLFFFLGNVRSAIIVALSLPLCALFALILMRQVGLSANLMSLGGLAVGIGMLVDASIVMVENIYRHLSNADEKGSVRETVRSAAQEVGRPILFAISIIVVVFLPLFTLQGVEGKMFSPMAFTIAFAMLGSLVVALIIAPVLSTFLMHRGGATARDNRFLSILKRIYRPLLGWTLCHKGLVIATAFLLLIGSLALVPFLGTEFIPTLEEGSILLRVTMAPSTSLVQATETVMALERKLMTFPEVWEVVSRTGRPEVGSHPHPVNYAEIHIALRPMSDWETAATKEGLIEKMNEAVGTYPGIQLSFSQPIQNAFEELLAGVKAELAIKVFGEEMEMLRRKAEEIRYAIEGVPGLVDLSVEQSYGQPQVQVIIDRERCARYGINVDEVQEVVEVAVGGETAGQVYQGVRRFDILVRLQEHYRDNVEAISRLFVHSESGVLIPLSDVADIRTVMAPVQINRENTQRYWTIQGNVRGRDLGTVVADVRRIIDEKVELPAGYYVDFGGQFENQQRAMRRLAVIVPLTIGLIFLMLFMTFGSVRNAALVICNIPLAFIGGIVALLISGQYLSVPASVGFIALFGVAVENGVVMIAYFNQLRRGGRSLQDTLIEGSQLRLRPVLMTAITTALGLCPLLLSRGIGAEVQRPLAAVVVGGLVTATFSTLFILPLLYGWFEKAPPQVDCD